METGWRELANKVDQIKDLLSKREDEHLELQRVVDMKKIKSEDLKYEVQKLKDNQNDMMIVLEREKNKLFDEKDIKGDLE